MNYDFLFEICIYFNKNENTYVCVHTNTHIYVYVDVQKALFYRYPCIALQVTPHQEATTGTQQDSIQHLTIANNVTDTQQSLTQHQPTPQYALPNKGTTSNKDQKARNYMIISVLLKYLWML